MATVTVLAASVTATTTNPITTTGNGGETITAGQPVYLNSADNELYKAVNTAASTAAAVGISNVPSADGKGLWGQTRHHVVDGKQIDVTLFTPPNTPPSTDPGALNPFVKGVGALQTIFDSGDPLLISTIQANLATFEQVAQKDQFLREQSKRIQNLEDECEALKKQISDLKKRIEADDTESGVVETGIDPTKQET